MSFAMISCDMDGEERTSSGIAALASQTFSGRVFDPTGAPVAGARVTINGITRVTTSSGQYAVVIAESQTGYRLDIRKDGFGPLTEFRLAGALSLVHRMIAGTTRVLSEGGGTTIVTDPASGIQVAVPAGVLRGNNGGLPVGSVRFTIIPHTSQTMPGDFTAQNVGGQRVALVSVGAVTLQAVDSQGNTLALAPNATLNVRMPVPAAAGGQMPACVLNGSCRAAMWRFVPATGLWVEQPGATTFTAGATNFTVRGVQRGEQTIDPSDGLGTWNADIEFNSPACTVISFASVPLDCYNPPPGSTPEPGIEVSFTQALAGGGTKSKTSAVLSSAAFIVLYNLRPNVAVDLSFTFPTGAPLNCTANLAITSTPAPNPGFPTPLPSGGATQVDSGAPWGGTGYPTNSGGLPVSFVDVATGDHPCNSFVEITTSL